MPNTSTISVRGADLGLLPLADRKLSLGQTRNGLVPIGLLAVALVLVGLRVIDVEVVSFKLI